MSIKYSHLTLAENFIECQGILTSETSTFFS